MKNKILIVDPSCAQVGYRVTEEELIKMIEQEDHPSWWKDQYKQVLVERWNEKRRD